MDITNPSPVPGTEQSAPASVSTENANSASSLKDVVKQATGRNYDTDEAAYKGIQDTFKEITSRHQQPVTTVSETPNIEVQLLRQELKASNFYADNPEFKSVRGLISKFGSDPEQVVKDPEFVKAYNALKTVSDDNKSVLTSNARIAMPKADDYLADQAAMRAGHMGVAEFLSKHKGVPMPTD